MFLTLFLWMFLVPGVIAAGIGAALWRWAEDSPRQQDVPFGEWSVAFLRSLPERWRARKEGRRPATTRSTAKPAARTDRPTTTAPAKTPPPRPERPSAGPRRAAPPSGNGQQAPMNVTRAEIPAVWTPVISWVAGFEPDEDADLMMFVRANAAAYLALADAWRNVAHHCATDVGLDPAAVQAIVNHADEEGEHAQATAGIWRRFVLVHREVQEWIAAGGQLPKSGRFLTGEGA